MIRRSAQSLPRIQRGQEKVHEKIRASAKPAYVGILGGVGPRATAELFRKPIDVTPAVQDTDHVPVFIYSMPQIPDCTAAILRGSASPLADLYQGIRTLESADPFRPRLQRPRE